MLGGGRMLVVFGGPVPEDNVIRYTAMIARMCQPEAVRRGRMKSRHAQGQLKPGAHWGLPVRAGARLPTVQDYPEIRFVLMLPDSSTADPTQRIAVAAKVHEYFAVRPEYGVVNVDLLKGRVLDRLGALAADFDTDFLLWEQLADSRRKSGRFAVEAPCAVWLVPPDWAPVVRRILVPVDFTSRAAVSLRAAIDLARHFCPAKCIALHVDRCCTRFSDDKSSPTRRRELESEFRRFVAAIDPRGIRIEPQFAQSSRIDRAIERAARDHAADLTVMICRRRSRLANAIHPSLAESVIRESAGPLLLLKSPEKPLDLLGAVQQHMRSADVPQYS
jgi:nucleotide-binding universal stress UspA family protein